MENYKKLVILPLFLFTLIFTACTGNDTNSSKTTKVQGKPMWYAEKVTVDSDKFETMEAKEVNVLPSADTGVQAIGKVNQGDTIKIIGFVSSSKFCKIRKDTLEGWVECSWLKDLPGNMTDYQ